MTVESIDSSSISSSRSSGSSRWVLEVMKNISQDYITFCYYLTFCNHKDILFFEVVRFILDISHHHFQNIFQSNQSSCSSVLIDNDRHMSTVHFHFCKHLENTCGDRYFCNTFEREFLELFFVICCVVYHI